MLTGLDIEAKAALVRSQSSRRRRRADVGVDAGPHRPPRRRTRGDGERAAALRGARTRCQARSGRAFSGAAVELALAIYPGFHVTAPPGDGQPVRRVHGGVRRRRRWSHTSRCSPDGARVAIPPATPTRPLADSPNRRCRPAPATARPGGCRSARSSARAAATRAAHANVGVWARTDAACGWLAHFLTVDRLRELLPETGRAAGRPARAAQPAGAQLRRRRHARRGRRGRRPVRPAGQGARRVAALPGRRDPGGPAVTVLAPRRATPVDRRSTRPTARRMLGEAGGAGRRAGQGGGRRRPEVRRAAPPARQAAGPRADRAAARPRLAVPGAVAARRPGAASTRSARSCVTGIGVVEGVECLIIANDPTVRGGASQPVDAEEGAAGPRDRAGEPAAADQPGRVRRRRPADPEGDLHPRRADVPRPDPAVRGRHPDDRAGLRQLHRRRRVRPGHERLRRDGRAAGEGVPRRPAAGEDGHRRGGRRRVAGRRGDARAARPGLADYLRRRRARRASGSAARSSARLNWRKLGPPPEPDRRPTALRRGRAARHRPERPEAAVRPARGDRPDRRRLATSTSSSRCTASSLVTGWAPLHGYPIGVLANARGVLFCEEAQKAAQFIQLANQADTPLLFLQNTTGYMVGKRVRAGRHHQARRADDQRGVELDRCRT